MCKHLFLFISALVFVASHGVEAFAPPQIKTLPPPPRSIPSPSVANSIKSHRGAPIRYRILDEQDDDSDPAAIKLLSRAPPNFKMQEELRNAAMRRKMSTIKPRSAINKPLIQALKVNQYGILALATVISALILLVSQGPGAFSNLEEVVKWTGEGSGLFDFGLSRDSLLLGIGGAMPLLAFSSWIESSDKRVFSNLNFSTIVLCLSLFGRRTAPPPEFLPAYYKSSNATTQILTTKSWQVLTEAFALSSITGFCEEAVFRRQVPALLANFFPGGSWVPFIGQALLFGLGHASPRQPISDNAVMVALQTFNGLGFATLLLLSGGQLVVPMIAHATYDFVTFFKTWNDANNQLEYAETSYKEPFPEDVERQVRATLRSHPQLNKDRVLITLKRLFYLFDFDKNASLTLSEVKKGLAYYFLEKRLTPPPDSEVEALFAKTIQSRREQGGTLTKDRLTFPDFLLLFSPFIDGPKSKSVLNIEKKKSAKEREKTYVNV